MIAENIAALLAAVQTVPALAQSAGLQVGGESIDPAMIKIALPAAWVLHASDRATAEADAAFIAVPQALQINYFVVVFLPYVSQSDLLATQFPLLESIIAAVRGVQAPDGTQFAYRGQRITGLNPGRITYEQTYSLIATV
jgi:hypothetical protein